MANKVFITQEHFNNGTYIADQPNTKYIIKEDIVFDQNSYPLHDDIPPPEYGITEHVLLPNDLVQFRLGFFAAILLSNAHGSTVEGVLKDNDEWTSITQSWKSYIRQRFYVHIITNENATIFNQGPGPFFKCKLLKQSNNVTIRNLNFNLTSHHCILANSVKNLTVENCNMKDFEFGGIHINGSDNTSIQNIHISRSINRDTFKEIHIPIPLLQDYEYIPSVYWARFIHLYRYTVYLYQSLLLHFYEMDDETRLLLDELYNISYQQWEIVKEQSVYMETMQWDNVNNEFKTRNIQGKLEGISIGHKGAQTNNQMELENQLVTHCPFNNRFKQEQSNYYHIKGRVNTPSYKSKVKTKPIGYHAYIKNCTVENMVTKPLEFGYIVQLRKKEYADDNVPLLDGLINSNDYDIVPALFPDAALVSGIDLIEKRILISNEYLLRFYEWIEKANDIGLLDDFDLSIIDHYSMPGPVLEWIRYVHGYSNMIYNDNDLMDYLIDNNIKIIGNTDTMGHTGKSSIGIILHGMECIKLENNIVRNLENKMETKYCNKKWEDAGILLVENRTEKLRKDGITGTCIIEGFDMNKMIGIELCAVRNVSTENNMITEIKTRVKGKGHNIMVDGKSNYVKSRRNWIDMKERIDSEISLGDIGNTDIEWDYVI